MKLGHYFQIAIDFESDGQASSYWLNNSVSRDLIGFVGPECCIKVSPPFQTGFRCIVSPLGPVIVGWAKLADCLIDDLEFILQTYQRKGDSLCEHLLGDFVFAMWDPARRCMLVGRDHLGAFPVYYWRQGSRWLLGSDPRVILAHREIPKKLNWRKLGAVGLEGTHLQSETLHEGIYAFPSASLIRINRSGSTSQRYWEPGFHRESAPQTETSAAEKLRELLFDCVAQRLRGSESPACEISGGLDSSIIGSIAARHLARSNRTLVGLSACLPEGHDPRLPQERDYSDEYAKEPNVILRHVSAQGGGPFDVLDEPEHFAATFKVYSRLYLHRAMEEEAAAHSVDVIFRGVGGELGPTYFGQGRYLELLANFRWIELARESSAYRRRVGAWPLRSMARDLLEVVRPWRQTRPLLVLAEGFRQQSGNRSALRWRFPGHRTIQLERQRFWVSRHMSARPWTHGGLIPFAYPLLDKRLLEFCLALPGNLKIQNGLPRYLVRQALRGVLPERIRMRTSKCPYSPDYYFRYNAGVGKARAFLQDIRPNDPVRAVVDVDRLQLMLHPVDPIKGEWEALLSIPTSIYLICFLRQFAEFRN